MRKFLESILQSRRSAIIAVLVCSVLPFFGWVGQIIMVLVTLRKGIKEGAIVLLWLLLLKVVLAVVAYPDLWVYSILGQSIITFGLTCLLRQTASWSWVLQIGTLVGIGAVLIVHSIMPDVNQVALQDISAFLNYYQNELQFKPEELQILALFLSKVAVGIQVMMLLCGDLFNLFVGRWLQAKLFHPEGFRQEVQSIRVGLLLAIALMLIVLGATHGLTIAWDLLPVVLVPFVIAGASLIHAIVNIKHGSRFWLIGFYAILFSLFLYVLPVLVMLVLVDNFLDYRTRLMSKLL